MTVSLFSPVLSLCFFFFFQCFLQRLVFRVSMAASSWLCKGPPRQILLSPLLSSQLPNSRSQQWALVDQLANLITLGWLPWDLLPERRRQRFVLPGINTSWIWICLLQTPPSTYLLIIIVPITTFLLTKALISQQKYSNWLMTMKFSGLATHSIIQKQLAWQNGGITNWRLSNITHWETTPWNFMALSYSLQYMLWVNNPYTVLFLP